MTIDELISEVLEIAAGAEGNWSIDLYRTLNQPIEKRLPIERLIDHYCTSAPELARRCKRMKEALENAADWMKTLHTTPITQDYGRCLEVIRLGAKGIEIETRSALAEAEK